MSNVVVVFQDRPYGLLELVGPNPFPAENIYFRTPISVSRVAAWSSPEPTLGIG